MKNILLKNVLVADPQSKKNGKRVDISIVKGVIEKIAKANSLSPQKSTQVLEEKGIYVSPGWVDMCVHLSDPGFEFKESVSSLAKAAQKGGFTDILCLPNTLPVVDNSQMLYSLKERTSQLPVNFHFTGAISQGTEGKELAELYDMYLAGAKAFTDGAHPLQSGGLLMRALQYLQAFGGSLITYPVDQTLASGGHMNESETSTLLGMKGNPELAESSMTTRNLEIFSYTGGKMHLQQMSSPTALQHISQAKRQFPDSLTVGVSIHNLVWDDSEITSFDPNYKLSPPLRSKTQVRKLRQALKSNKIDVICSGHFAQGIEQKQVEFYQAEPGILGLQTFFSLAETILVQGGFIDYDDLVRLISINPRKILNLPENSISEGKPACLTLFNPKATWDFTEKDVFSRARNSPLLGKSLTGKVMGICQKGELILNN